MSEKKRRTPFVDKLYYEFLQDEDCARFIDRLSQNYLTSTLQRLAGAGRRVTRRASVLALGFLGDFGVNITVGSALHDPDRGVRMLAENSLRSIWSRYGTDAQRKRLGIVNRLNGGFQFEEAIELASDLVAESPEFAEVWNQRAVAFYSLADYYDAIDDCQEVLRLNPFHFGAAAGMGQCYLELDEPVSALECFRLALNIHPDLEGIRAQATSLQRALDET